GLQASPRDRSLPGALGWAFVRGLPLGLLALVLGVCLGLEWDGESDGDVRLGVLLWPILLLHLTLPVRGLALAVAGPFVQVLGYAGLLFLVRLLLRRVR